ncbi:glycine/D-amino acid oxidase-like deaminating enzyme [Gillisia sp. Hel_I_86]|uniref:NAD(P)/FAD-dependent oxidoreductase n=1 Tax=Gillisia sp. Hel_I_86 TaxID=1249981 RepID=UPI00119A1B16|nr:FAD-dependent oxidoreductase [Gillisia sp. Hel_I_86]TVZ26335.1 glycine/D-amino acid oxidase-like deaminating enzyme [Gillisia sp. Hel_I_86]
MNLSYWEHKSWLSNIDHTIIGSGIVGLNTALRLREKFPKTNILILERGFLPNGASTKNAGFACFGSLSEMLDDLNTHSEEEVVQLVQKRVDGLALLRKTLGDGTIDFNRWGGYELFTPEDKALLEECESKIEYVNKLLFPIFKENVFSTGPNKFNFKKIKETVIFNKFEGQINTGKMMEALLKKAANTGIKILNNISVEEFSEGNTSVKIKTDQFEFTTKKLLIATNGFAVQLGLESVKPARAQVLITKPIENLQIKGTFHLHKGYYYFRNIDKRILLGGGRNLDLKTEETTTLGETALIQDKLEELLKETILPNMDFEIDRRWSGIMGVGTQKKPIVKQLSDNTFCGVRLGGMGVAIGSLVGRELADLITH